MKIDLTLCANMSETLIPKEFRVEGERGLMTPFDVHHGVAGQRFTAREAVLQRALEANPERFVRGVPKPPAFPREVWVNKPRTNDEPTGALDTKFCPGVSHSCRHVPDPWESFLTGMFAASPLAHLRNLGSIEDESLRQCMAGVAVIHTRYNLIDIGASVEDSHLPLSMP